MEEPFNYNTAIPSIYQKRHVSWALEIYKWIIGCPH